MAELISCPRCKKAGFIRIEHVIRGGRAVHSYYCGSCMYEWQMTEHEPSKKSTRRRKPDRPPRE